MLWLQKTTIRTCAALCSSKCQSSKSPIRCLMLLCRWLCETFLICWKFIFVTSGLLCLDSVSFRSLERHCSLIWEISISYLGLILISFPQWSPLCIPPPKTKKQQRFYQAVVSVSKTCTTSSEFHSNSNSAPLLRCSTQFTQKSWSYNWQSSNPRNASNCTSHPRSQQRTGNPMHWKLVSAIISSRQGP